jgi:hypothetical protein
MRIGEAVNINPQTIAVGVNHLGIDEIYEWTNLRIDEFIVEL